LTVDAIYENLRFYQISELNSPQLGSTKPDLPLIPIANKRQIDRSSIRQLHSSRSEVGQKCLSSKDWRSFRRELSRLVPKGRGEGNSGALSLEPFEMSGLNFQVSVEHVGIGSAGEKKE
jgi:hypothetical protein